ncbi:MAG TPA: dynamin family protein, partial [Polyangia bacterium]|nr:dynamin family protein [Polyangia bacterium]
MSGPVVGAASADDRKLAIRGVLSDLAAAAEAAGLPFVARDIRETRLPKLDEERFSVVVLGEFNHGKSTFINALLGAPVLPTGITPTSVAVARGPWAMWTRMAVVGVMPVGSTGAPR